MQYDMYHTYTVDEHTIRALELLSEVERGTLAEDHPLANDIIHKVISRKVLYVAVFLHDIAKGRKGDHSILGAGVARKLCPRFGLTAAETQMVEWLVLEHLLMVKSCFKRDLNDPKTISDFSNAVQSPERLRLLLVLTVVDIRAVGPGVWNGWKGQLLRELYYRAEEYLLGGQIEGTNGLRLQQMKAEVRANLDEWTTDDFRVFESRFFDSYWLANQLESHIKNAKFIRQADKAQKKLTFDIQSDKFQNITELTVYTVDHPGLFARLTGAIALSGASIQHAKVFTTKDGMALDTFWVQKTDGTLFNEKNKHKRLRDNIIRVIAEEKTPDDLLSKMQPPPQKRTDVFKVEPMVLIDNNASNSYTLIEVNGRDRAGHLFDLSKVFSELKISIVSAHVATYGERAITVFFVKDLFGHKVTHVQKIKKIEEKLMDVLVKALI
jgi:[protein-PII] uridylyltransferase